ncbi:MAG TPA: hypothetical protein VGL46_12620 [Pseudonocardiaceae bacterium]|jgi:hypothetical protein
MSAEEPPDYDDHFSERSFAEREGRLAEYEAAQPRREAELDRLAKNAPKPDSWITPW